MADLNFRKFTEAESSESASRKGQLSGDGNGGDWKMTKNTDNTARDKVFGNPLLMDRITGYAINFKSNLEKELRSRLVNKTFNQAVLRYFRKEFRDISIGGNPDGKVTLNGCWVQLKRLDKFGTFLKNAAKVEFHAIRVIGVDNYALLDVYSWLMGMVENNYEKLKVFTGLDLYRGRDQDKCARIAARCREYGPMKLNVLLDAFCEQTHHYDTLVVSEYLLETIAIQSAKSAVDKNDCLERMAAIITPNIICRRLVLNLHEKPYGCGRRHFPFHHADCTAKHPLPREIIDEMIRKWKVRNVKFEFHAKTIGPIVSELWTKFGYFTQIRFDQSYENVRPSNYLLDLVEVDLENATHIWKAIVDDEYRRMEDNRAYEHLFANVRRMFPTKEMNVRFLVTSQFCSTRTGRPAEMIEHFMNSVWIDNPKDLKTKIDMFSYLDPAFNSHQPPSHFRHRTLKTRMTMDVGEVGERIGDSAHQLRRVRGKRHVMIDERNNCQIDFGIFNMMEHWGCFRTERICGPECG